MKIIFLNCWWTSEIFESTKSFLKSHLDDTDIFCLTELTEDRYEDLKLLFPSFKSFFSLEKKLKNSTNAEAIFVENDIEVRNYKSVLLYDSWNNDEVPGHLQIVDLKIDNKEVRIGNLQGMAFPGDKKDNQMRINQAKTIIKEIKTNIPIVFGGDFNLFPDTESIQMFEKEGYLNLITKFKIRQTRNHYAWEQAEKQAKEKSRIYFGRQLFSDYCFVSKDIKVNSFNVPNIEVSDHLPLILDFEF